MINEKISITAISSISPLGESLEESWNSYQNENHFLKEEDFSNEKTWVGRFKSSSIKNIEELRGSDVKYKKLDNSVIYALFASRNAVRMAGWIQDTDQKVNFGINIGSSRGATELFEKYHAEFLEKNKVASLASPTTTLGNIASWVAHDLQTEGPVFSHSITCSTALHAMLNGIAWLKSGMANKFLVGGSEAPLTPFTIAQMKALKIYSKETSRYPSMALDLEKTKNTMVLGEAASMACLETGVSKNSLALVKGVGYATEALRHNVSISADAECFQQSMKMALGDMAPSEIDVIVMHAPGTIKGDQTEFNAIKKVFRDEIPFLTTNKWKVGHTFGSSGMLSIEMAVLMLDRQKVIKVPYLEYENIPKKINTVMVNAVGFGGNAVSILLSRPST